MPTNFLTTSEAVRIAYDVIGQGPSLMLLHGAGKTRKDWEKAGYIDRLKNRYTVINVDIRGSGESSILTRSEDYTIEKICFDMDMVADECGTQELMVWGYSFGGNISRYLGAWSERVRAIAVTGVPFGRAVDEAFDRYIDAFIEKYGPLAQAYNQGALSEKEKISAIKGRIPVWVACFQAIRGWPVVEAGDINCPAMLVAGTKNTSVMEWLKGNSKSLESSKVQVEIIEGLTHQQEFSQVERVFPIVEAFLERSATGRS